MKTIYVLGGGTFNHVRNHCSLAVPAFGETAKKITSLLVEQLTADDLLGDYQVKLILTKMADSNSTIVTNDDVMQFVKEIIRDPNTSGIVFNVALADFSGQIGDVPSGKYATRLQSRGGVETMTLTPSEKIISLIRKERKDIFTVGFKTTCGEDELTQYSRGLKLLKENSLNLVLANDTSTRRNVIIAPEESQYCATSNRSEVLAYLVKMFTSRMRNTFTRSTVIPGDAVRWDSDEIPSSLRAVVNHCISGGAYKPFLNKTVGHFAVKHSDSSVLTSIRKSNFNNLVETGLVRIDSTGDHEVIAHGFKPSVGGQSQRIIFKEHPELDCIVHFHCPVKRNARDLIPTKQQWPNECGSHECGKQTSDGLIAFPLPDGDYIKAVFLSDHGPNIVFNRKVNPQHVIDFIEANFDLRSKTGGMV